VADILITHGTVIAMDPARRVIADGAVAIGGGRILAVGTTAEVAAAHDAPRRIDARAKAVMPGLIDGHAHAGHGLVKTMGGSDTDAWYAACERIYTLGSDEGFWRAEAMLTALERLKAGVTTGVSLLGGGDDIMRTDDPAYGAAHAEGVQEVGTRSIVAVGPCRPPFPRPYAQWRNGTAAENAVPFEQQIETCEALIAAWHGGAEGRIRIAFTFPVHMAKEPAHAAHLPEIRRQARIVAELARARGLILTQDGHRDGSLRQAHEEFGLTGPNALFSHAIDLTAEEIAICRETGTAICHNPSAVMSIRGRCPVPELIDAGVTVMLGSDGTAPDRSADMFRHMQQAMHYHRRHFRDEKVLPHGKVLEMATIDAAHALGLGAELGSLEPGKQADVILVDLMKPHLLPLNMPVHRITAFANGADVDTVIVGGRVLMEGRQVLSVDERSVMRDAQAATERMLERTGLASLLVQPVWGRSRA